MFLARKITRAKWSPKKGISTKEISADAITADLRTRDNNLSFWKCDPTSNESIENVALAIAATGERVDKVELVWISDDKLPDDCKTLKNTEGETPVTDLAKQHFDLCELDYVRLGKVAHIITAAIKAEQYHRLTESSVTKLLAKAVEQERLDLNDLKKKVKKKVKKLLDPEP